MADELNTTASVADNITIKVAHHEGVLSSTAWKFSFILLARTRRKADKSAAIRPARKQTYAWISSKQDRITGGIRKITFSGSEEVSYSKSVGDLRGKRLLPDRVSFFGARHGKLDDRL